MQGSEKLSWATSLGLGVALLRRSAVWRDVDSVPPMYRRSLETASCRESEFVAENEAVGVAYHIRASNLFPGILPPLQDKRSYESGQNIGGAGTGPTLSVALSPSRSSCSALVISLHVRPGSKYR